MFRTALIAACIALGGLLPSGRAAAVELSFERDIRPILKTHCFECHGEGEELKGKVDLRLRRFMAGKETEDGRVLVPGKPSESLLFELTRKGEMPKGEKKLSAKEVALLRAWIEAGAPTESAEPAELPKGFHITTQERQFWSFQPIRRPALPAWAREDGAKNGIDVFVLKKLREEKLSFAPEAPKRTLIRRAYLDLTGLPPAPEEVERFAGDASPDAYEKLIDRLLDSSAYGERWARQWLDTAGYADSNGYAEADSVRPHAWRYRDYVIRAFNSDKPWNEFIREQLAGDELAGVTVENSTEKARDPRTQELLAATGFLRMAPDGTADEVADQNAARNQVMAETIKIVSSSLLGLTVGCAQCHDHRYEPISQRDYYATRAIFEPTLDWKNWRNPNQRLVSLYSDEDRKKADEIETEVRKIDAAAEEMRKEFLEKVFVRELAKVPENVREKVKEARNTPGGKRSAEQIALLKVYPSADVQGALDLYDPEAHKQVIAKQAEAIKLRGSKPPQPLVSAAMEFAGKVPPTFLFARGDHEQPKEKIEPAGLEILRPALAAWDGSANPFDPRRPELVTSGRRLAYANWLASGKHPLVARVLVNRFWLHHFGRGLVNTPADFGQQGERPTHPELLDWLASEFMDGGWKLKPLHRLIMTSRVYRQSTVHEDSLQNDPDNRWYGRMKLQRLEAETLRDSILAVSGKLNAQPFGPAVPIARDDAGRVVPGNQKNNGAGDPVLVDPIGDQAFRRSIYVQVRRSLPLTMLDLFDAPVMSPNCELRNTSTVAPQSLAMLNDRFIAEQSEYFAQRLLAEKPGDARAQVNRAWGLVYGTRPGETDVNRSLVYLAEQTEQIRARLNTVPQSKSKTPRDPQLLALASFCQSLLSANSFLYAD